MWRRTRSRRKKRRAGGGGGAGAGGGGAGGEERCCEMPAGEACEFGSGGCVRTRPHVSLQEMRISKDVNFPPSDQTAEVFSYI